MLYESSASRWTYLPQKRIGRIALTTSLHKTVFHAPGREIEPCGRKTKVISGRGERLGRNDACSLLIDTCTVVTVTASTGKILWPVFQYKKARSLEASSHHHPLSPGRVQQDPAIYKCNAICRNTISVSFRHEIRNHKGKKWSYINFLFYVTLRTLFLKLLVAVIFQQSDNFSWTVSIRDKFSWVSNDEERKKKKKNAYSWIF